MVALPDPVLSGAIEGLVGAVVEPAIGWLVEKVRGRLAAAGPSKVDQAFAAARERAKGLVEEFPELTREPAQAAALAVFAYSAFEHEALRRVLFSDGPDLDPLEALFRKVSVAEGAAPTEEEVSAARRFFHQAIRAIEREMTASESLAALLGDTQRLIMDARLDHNVLKIREHTEQIADSTARGAAASERTADELGETNKTLRRIADKLGERKPQRQAPRPKARITPAEGDYLRELLATCDRLPLAENARQDERERRAGGQRASLLNVYVDLATTRAPTLDEVCDRLGIPPKQRGRFRGSLRRQVTRSGGAARGLREIEGNDGDGPLLVLLRRGDSSVFGKVALLKPFAEDEATLAAALAPETALEALCRGPECVLLGPPGSGKSTFVQHLAGTFAQALLGEAPDWAKALENHFAQPLFPVRIVLSQWAKKLGKNGPDEAEHIRKALPRGVSWARWCERFREPGTLLLLDGLDEVPTAVPDGSDPRARLLTIIDLFRRSHPQPKILLTCRVRPYRDAEAQHKLAAWPELELAPLDPPRIERFCHRWYEETLRIRGLGGEAEARAHIEALRDHLLHALRQKEKVALREMATLPLLLTMLARVNLRERLPEGRLALYRECAEQLLWEWEKAKAGDGAGGQGYETLDRYLAEIPRGMSREEFEGVLCELAYAIHPEVPDGVAELPKAKLESRLRALRTDEANMAAWAVRVIDFLMRRDGLLVKRDDATFSFPHRSFQEFFAARRLVLLHREGPELTTRAAEEVWYEVSLLACAELAKEETRGVLPALEDLLTASDANSPAGWRRALILGRVWLELKPRMVPFQPSDPAEARRQKLEREVPPLLERVLKSAAVPAARRLEAGQILDDLGILPRDLGALVEIPADRQGYAFKIGKYPVTNAEFRRFVEAGGYDREAPWWTAQAKEEIERLWPSWPEGPRLWPDPKWSRGSFPVVGISWHEAKAYCAWLTEELRQGEGPQRIESDVLVTLPSGAEWEAAARGEGSGKYPWGDAVDEARANTEESQLAATTPVHMYPPQALAPELFDLVGNIWEWLEDPYQDWGQWLSGGAFYKGAKDLGTAARGRNYRDSWNRNSGFRVVVVPSSRRNSEF